MKKNVDFLFVYEVKSRELENICLIRYELERRGYSVEFINTWYYLNRLIPKITARVLVVFALYDDDVFDFVSNYCQKFDKVINFYWEQTGVLSEEKDMSASFFLKGIAKKALNLAWGKKTVDRLISCGIDEKHIGATGHVGMDYLSKRMLPYYLSREELFSAHNIPVNKKVCLFISSFSLVKKRTDGVSGFERVYDLAKQFISSYDIDDRIEFSAISQKIIIEWIIKLLEKRNDLVFVYRPHPSEYVPEEIMQLANESEQFFVISDHSIRQWIIACDIITTWQSTSIAEVFFSGKTCHILRPVNIPPAMDLATHEGAAFITNADEFESAFKSEFSPFPLNEALLRQYYMNDDNMSYIKVCDAFEEVLKDATYCIAEGSRTFRANVKRRIIWRLLFSKYVLSMSNVLKNRLEIFQKIYFANNVDEYTSQMQKRNYASDEEVASIMDKIKHCLEE